MKLGTHDPEAARAQCFLCREVFKGADARDDLTKHLRLEHHRLLVTFSERRGKTCVEGPRQGWTGELPGFVFREL